MTYGFFKHWIPLALLATLLCVLVYGAVQQDMRQSANDPQIALAEDAAASLAAGHTPDSVVASSPIAIEKSLAPFVIVYDANGKPLASGGTLAGKIPIPPSGVFAMAVATSEDRVTWQPQPDVRLATIVTPYHSNTASGFVLAARSLREVEQREDQLARNVGIGWIATLVATAVTLLFIQIITQAGTSRKR